LAIEITAFGERVYRSRNMAASSCQDHGRDDCRSWRIDTENVMHTRSSFTMLALVGISVLAAVAGSELARAQATQYPILDAVTNKVILKYQQSSCEQLWQKKSEPPSAEQQKLVSLLRSDPQMRAAFINKVAAPIANKMFDCGLIP